MEIKRAENTTTDNFVHASLKTISMMSISIDVDRNIIVSNLIAALQKIIIESPKKKSLSRRRPLYSKREKKGSEPSFLSAWPQKKTLMRNTMILDLMLSSMTCTVYDKHFVHFCHSKT